MIITDFKLVISNVDAKREGNLGVPPLRCEFVEIIIHGGVWDANAFRFPVKTLLLLLALALTILEFGIGTKTHVSPSSQDQNSYDGIISARCRTGTGGKIRNLRFHIPPRSPRQPPGAAARGEFITRDRGRSSTSRVYNSKP